MLIVGEVVAPTGYAWVFPVSEHRARIGVGITQPGSNIAPLALLDRFIQDRPRQLRTFGKISPIEIHIGSVPIESPPTNSVADGLIVVGDAACQANPIVGEGIRNAMKFGKLAAETAAQAIEDGNTKRESLARYETESKKLSKLNSISLALQKRSASFLESDWNDAIERIRVLNSNEFFALLRGDFTKRNVAEMVLHHPKLFASTTFQMLKKMV